MASSPSKRFTREKISVFKVLRTKGDKETKRQRDKESKRQRVKETKGQRDKESKRRRDEETKGKGGEESKRQRGKGQGTAWDFEFPRRLRDVNGGRRTPPKAVAVGGVS